MPPFQPKARVPVPAPTLPSSTAPRRGGLQRREHVRRPHGQRADVVQTAVVGLADERVHRPDLIVARLRQRPLHEALDDGANRQGVGQGDRASRSCRARPPGSSPASLPKALPDEHRAGHLVLEHVAGVRHDDGDAGAGAVALAQREMADETPSTSVMALRGPGSNTPGASPMSRARGRAGSCAASAAIPAGPAAGSEHEEPGSAHRLPPSTAGSGNVTRKAA